MQAVREIMDIHSEQVLINVPREFKNRRVEVIILPLEDKTGDSPGESQEKLSKEAEDFLNLGGSGSWEGNLDEMREGRNGIG